MQTTATTFDLWGKIDRLIGKLPQETQNDSELVQSIEDHLVRRTIDIASGMMDAGEVDRLLEELESKPDLTLETVERFVADRPDIHFLIELEFANFESVLLNR